MRLGYFTVMRTNIAALPADATCGSLAESLGAGHVHRRQVLYPVVDPERRLVGVLTRGRLREIVEESCQDGRPLAELARTGAVVAYPDEPLRVVVYRMAETGLTRFPVVDRGPERKLVGMLSLADMLRARTRNLEEERTRERVLRLHLPFLGRRARRETVEA